MGRPTPPSTQQLGPPRASPLSRRETFLEVLKARKRVLARWRKAKKGPCPYLIEMSDERLLELDAELAALREEHLRSVAAGTVRVPPAHPCVTRNLTPLRRHGLRPMLYPALQTQTSLRESKRHLHEMRPRPHATKMH